ncbi:MAG: mechanosensitive ion channel family protein [Thioalkalispiraceae bacterium]|jgi:small-conductance mechanosensitive channel
MDWLTTHFAGNTVLTWLIAACLALAVLLIAGMLRFLACKQLNRLTQHHPTPVWHMLLEAVRKTNWLFLLIVALFFGSIILELSVRSDKFIYITVIIALLLQGGLWTVSVLRISMETYRQQQLGKDPANVTTLNLLNFIGRIIIWTIVLLLVLDNLGINITALVAGLGVGGIAVALALQTILGDLFASLSIVLDKPFVVGDFLIIEDLLGSVEYVGLKTTRLRSLSGEQLIFSNADLLKSRIRNFGRMYERRVQFDIGVTYQTPRSKLIKIPEIIREAVEKQDKTRFDRSHFKAYGDFSLLFESVYYVNGPDYNQYMDVQQAINLHIHERFEQEEIEFAYPTQMLYVKQT